MRLAETLFVTFMKRNQDIFTTFLNLYFLIPRDILKVDVFLSDIHFLILVYANNYCNNTSWYSILLSINSRNSFKSAR